MFMKKKGQASMAVGAIISLVIGIAVATLVLLFSGVLGGKAFQLVESDINAIGNNSVINDTFTALNNTAVGLSHQNIHPASLAINNGTHTVALTNFNINYVSGSVTLTNNVYNASSLNATYNYGSVEIGQTIKDGITAGFEAQKQTGEFMPLIVIGVVISIVLVLVLTLPGAGGTMRGGAL